MTNSFFGSDDQWNRRAGAARPTWLDVRCNAHGGKRGGRDIGAGLVLSGFVGVRHRATL